MAMGHSFLRKRFTAKRLNRKSRSRRLALALLKSQLQPTTRHHELTSSTAVSVGAQHRKSKKQRPSLIIHRPPLKQNQRLPPHRGRAWRIRWKKDKRLKIRRSL